MRIILMGPPGAGKGTQAAVISRQLGVPHISSGEIFRANMTAGTQLGACARTYIDRGEYVPDAVTNGMIRERLARSDAASGFLLDGYPRTLAQINELDAMLLEQDTVIDKVIELTASPEAVVHRLLARADVEGRTDDNHVIIRNRLLVYHQQTSPLTDVYDARGVLARVDALGTVSEVSQRIMGILQP